MVIDQNQSQSRAHLFSTNSLRASFGKFRCISEPDRAIDRLAKLRLADGLRIKVHTGGSLET